MGSGHFQFGTDHSRRPSFKKEFTLPFQQRQNQSGIHVLPKVLCLTGKAGTQPQGTAPDTCEEQPAAFPVGQVCPDNLQFTLGTDQVSYSPLFVGS